MDFVHNFGPRRKKFHLSTRRKLKVLLALNSKSQKCLSSSIDSDCEHDLGKDLMTLLQCEQFHIERLKELMKVFMHPIVRENSECVNDLIGLVEEMLSTHGTVCAGLFSSASDSFIQLCSCLDAYVSYCLLIHLEKSHFQKIFGKHKDIFLDDEILQEPILYISKCKDLLEKLYCANPQEVYYNTLKHVEMTWSDVKSQLFVRENTVRMLQIQRALFKREPKILSPGRILIKEGILYKVNQKGSNMKPKVFFLFNDSLLCCKILTKTSDEYERNSLLFSTLLPLKMCAVVLIMGSSKQGALFKITCGTLSYLLISKVPGEAQSWFEELQIAIRSSQKLAGELKLKLNRKTKVFKQSISPFSKKTF